MTQQQFNYKHHKTIWHIRHTVWRWKKRGGYRPCWLPYFCKMMLILGVLPKMEFKKVCDALKDAIDSGLIVNPGFSWNEKGEIQPKDVVMSFDVFCETRFGTVGSPAPMPAEVLSELYTL